jgi:hypothetical protein
MVDKHALMRACGVNSPAYVRAYEVSKHAYVCAYGLNSCALGDRLMGVKLIFLMFFMVNMVYLGLLYVVVGNHLA